MLSEIIFTNTQLKLDMKESKTGLSLNDRRTVVLEQVVPLKLVQLNFTQPFTWASGWLSPIYCNFRQLLRYPQARGVTARALAQGVRENYPNATVILGVATGSIAIAMAVAEELGLPYGYVREKPKDHGTGDQIEGGIEKGDQAVIVEDVVSTGGSLLRAVEAVRNDGRAEVLGTATIMTYGFPVAIESFEKDFNIKTQGINFKYFNP